MRLAALDASTATAVVGVLDGDRVEVRAAASTARAEQLLPLLDDALKALGLAPAALDAIVVGVGPGSFTGVRIAVATAKGLAWSLGKPLHAVSSLAALALGATETSGGISPGARVVAILDAYRREVYRGIYVIEAAPLPSPALGGAIARPIVDDAVGPPAELADAVRAAIGDAAAPGMPPFVVGGGVSVCKPEADAVGRVIDAAPLVPSARSLLALGAAAHLSNPGGTLAAAEPAYLRPAEAERVLSEPLPPPAPPRES